MERKSESNFFFDLLFPEHRCSVNAQIGNNATDWKRRRFRSNINVPLHIKTIESKLKSHINIFQELQDF